MLQPNTLELPDDGALETASIEELKSEINHLTSRLSNLSASLEGTGDKVEAIEGIGNLMKRIAFAFTNLTIKVIKNVTSTIKGLVGIKRSALRESINSEAVYYPKLRNAEYPSIYKTVIQSWSFKENPIKTASFFNEVFHIFNIAERGERLLSIYNQLAPAIKLGNNDTIEVLLKDADASNIKAEVKTTITYLKKTVVNKPSNNRATIGTVFKSTKAMAESIDHILISHTEISNYLRAVKIVKKLETSWKRLIKAVDKSSSDLNFKLVNKLADMIEDTGTLFNIYGTVGLEYHHAEMFMSHVVRNGCKTIAKKI